jgi:type I restriction enzyme S subunit
MSFPRYAEYKDSGVEWLGDVPAHWTLMSLARVTEAKCDGPFGSGIKSEHYTDTGAVVIRLQNIRAEGFNAGDPAFIALDYFEQELRRHEVLAGDVLVAGLGDDNNIVGRACVAPDNLGPALVKADCFRFRVQLTRVRPRFLAAQLTAGAPADAGRLSSGSTRSRIPLGEMASRPVCLPPLSEQDAINRFLDRETAKIDALVEEQQRLIELLKEKRQAVISQAVTKGLDPNVPMKNSGVEWLGTIPAHWEALALKRVSPVQTVGIVVNPSVYVASEGLPFLYGGDIQEGRIDLTGCRRISPEDSDRNPKTRLEAGDLVTVRVGAPGVTAVVPPEAEGGNCASVMLIRRGDFDSRWLCYTMNDRVVRFQVEVVQYGAAQEQFNISHAVEFIIPRPGREEQTLIADHLDKETVRFDALVFEAESAMRLLGERRSALISAAVTGKIDVRGGDDLPTALAAATADIAAGRFVVESPEAHLARIRAMISRDG